MTSLDHNFLSLIPSEIGKLGNVEELDMSKWIR